MQNLCNVIGQKYGKTESSVERAMQNAINKAWRTCDIDDLLHYYTARISSDKGVRP
jgi:flavin-binding protein dodecin